MGCCNVRDEWPVDDKDGIVGLIEKWEEKNGDEKEGEESEGAKLSQETNDVTEPDPPPLPEQPPVQCPSPAPVSSLPVTALSGLIRAGDYPDMHFSALEEYILTLESSEKWRLIDQPQTGVVGKKLPRSKFNGEVPVFHLTMDFPQAIPGEFILGMLEEPDWRSDWDHRVEQMNRIYLSAEDCFLHYMLIKCNAPLKNREILVRQRVRREGPEVRVTFQSTTHQASPK